MQATSLTHKQIVTVGEYTCLTRAVIAGETYYWSDLISAKSKRGMFGQSFGIGASPCSDLTLKMKYPSTPVPRMAPVEISVAVKDGQNTAEWIPKGVFWIDTRSDDWTYQANGLQTMEIHGYDAMAFGDGDCPSDGLTFPASEIDVVRVIAAHLNPIEDSRYDVTVDPETEALIQNLFPIPSVKYYSSREILGFIAGVYGGSFVITERNTLKLVTLGDSSIAFNIGLNAGSLKASNPIPTATGVTVVVDKDTSYTAGDASGYVFKVENPFGSQAMAESILERMRSQIDYQPFEASNALVDPAIEIGDPIVVGSVSSCAAQITTTFGPLLLQDISAPDDGSIDHEIPYQSKTQRETARASGGVARNTKKIKENENEIRKIRTDWKELIAKVDGVISGGLHAIATANDIEKAKEAKTTVFAMVTEHFVSELELYAKTKDLEGYTTTEVTSDLVSKIDDINAGLQTLVRKTDQQGWQLVEASSRLYASIDDVKAEISAMAIQDGQGRTKTLAQILADQIKLDSQLTITDGTIVSDKMWAQTSLSVGLGGMTLSGPLNYQGKIYEPKSITSTDGTDYAVLAS